MPKLRRCRDSQGVAFAFAVCRIHTSSELHRLSRLRTSRASRQGADHCLSPHSCVLSNSVHRDIYGSLAECKGVQFRRAKPSWLAHARQKVVCGLVSYEAVFTPLSLYVRAHHLMSTPSGSEHQQCSLSLANSCLPSHQIFREIHKQNKELQASCAPLLASFAALTGNHPPNKGSHIRRAMQETHNNCVLRGHAAHLGFACYWAHHFPSMLLADRKR